MPFLMPAYASGPFEWASSALEGMRREAGHLIAQPLTTLSEFLSHSDTQDQAHMGACMSASPRQPGDDDGYIVTDWKLRQAQQVDNAHLVTHNPAGVVYSQQHRRDGAHLLNSWTNGAASGKSGDGEEEHNEDIPDQLPPTALPPGDKEHLGSAMHRQQCMHCLMPPPTAVLVTDEAGALPVLSTQCMHSCEDLA